METTFFGFVCLPPPAAGTFVFARTYGARAGIAADAGVALQVERMFGQLIFPRVAKNILCTPVRQGRNFYRCGGTIDNFDVAAGFALGAAESGKECAHVLHALFKRADLSNIAAEQALRVAVAEQINAL